MAHFARIEDGIVTTVLAVSDCAIGGCIGPSHPDYVKADHLECGALDFPDTEPLGQKMLANSGFSGDYIQCSYSGSFRGAYPGKGWRYDDEREVFIAPEPPAVIEPAPAS